MADVYTHQQHHTISPTVLSSSRPPTPLTSGPGASSLAGPSSQPALAFDPEAYIDLADLHNPPSFDPAALGFVPQQSAGPSDLGSLNSASASASSGAGMPFATGSMGMTRTGSSSSGGGSTGGPRTRARTGALPLAHHHHNGGGSFVSFDPDDGDGALDQDDASDDDDRAVEGRPRKRKSVRDLRGAASSQASAAVAPATKDDGGAGGDEDKTRRKISIEYIEEKSKRHITFSKRKAGIMKKVRRLSSLSLFLCLLTLSTLTPRRPRARRPTSCRRSPAPRSCSSS